MSRRRPAVVAFDVNETLLDLAPVRAALVEAGQPASLLGAVFARTLLTGAAATVVGDWCSFREAFASALEQEAALGPDARAGVLEAFGELSPHPDVEPALRRLTEAGVRVVTLTHGSPGVAEAGLARGGVTPLVEASLSSESIRAWKPAREVYLWAAGRCRVAPDRLALVAAHGWGTCWARSGPG
ncbi:HAD family hydrolase [Blastococcus sp. TML/C7B]|uniref:HAD family hydrolase n=1 Tax=Blastococcus sp. TML/C7B TaxID=2798728 RepID=UPI001F5BAF91|nr:HAD family hydrolase [Blastococcus sp. TML/C7B]